MKTKYSVNGEIKIVSSKCIMEACYIAEDDEDEEVVVCKGQGKVCWD